MSLLEILLAGVLVVAATIPLLDTFGGLRRGLQTSTRRVTALFLAQSILENVRYRLYNFGPFAGALPAPADRNQAIVEFFEELREEGAQVATDSDPERSLYFARIEDLSGTGLHGICRASHPNVFPRLAAFSCRLEVISDSPETDGDGDGRPDEGLAELSVVIHWQEPTGGPEQELRLWTLLSARRHGHGS